MDEIRETGVKGFLVWLQQAQPDLYTKIAPQISAKVPGAFTDYHQGNYKIAGLSHYEAVAKLNGLGDANVLDTSSFDYNSQAAPTVDVSDAANSGGISSGITDTIASIVGGISSLYLTKQQANIQQQVVNTQLQRAAAGLPPLPTSLANLGVPQVSVGLSTGTGSLITVLGIGFGAVLLLGMLSKRK